MVAVGRASDRIDAVVAQAAADAEHDADPPSATFVRRFLADVAPRDLEATATEELADAAVASWQQLRQRMPGTPNVHVDTPGLDDDQETTRHTTVIVVTDDMPFLVDSVSMELTRRDLAIHLVIHPILAVVRDADGQLQDLATPQDDGTLPAGAHREAVLHVRIDRRTHTDELEDIRRSVLDVLADVRAAVQDWPRMREQLATVRGELDTDPPPVEPDELAEARELLTWLDDDHFTFLGYREYDLERTDAGEAITARTDTGLGILRDAPPTVKPLADLPPEIGELARERRLLTLTKANAFATVHRPSRLDYVGVKRFGPDGEVVGEHRFLGLYTSRVYSARPQEIPVVRRKAAQVIDRAALPPDSHDGKHLVAILESLPRDELFDIDVDELERLTTDMLGLQERHQVRLFARRDRFGRYLSCLVFVPRDRYTTQTRLEMQRILADAVGATDMDHSVLLSESSLARLHLVARAPVGELRSPDLAELEQQLARVTRTWTDELTETVLDRFGEARGRRLLDHHLDAFPSSYREEHGATDAVADLERLLSLDPDSDLTTHLSRPDGDGTRVRFVLYRSGRPITLSQVLPQLENLGFDVIDQRPYRIQPSEGAVRWIHDLGLTTPAPGLLDSDERCAAVQEAFARVWSGQCDDDGLNRLVLQVGLSWREVSVLRGYARYLRQATARFSQDYMQDTLVGNPQVTGLLVRLFHARLDPGAEDREAAVERCREELDTALDEVASLDEDRILRSFRTLIDATLRTNVFRTDAEGQPRTCLAFKLDAANIPDLPRPRPAFEIFAHSPRVEGVHLRGGAVARGGLRWSDRREDLRTEILDLTKAQTVKNAVIVPVGAKGGFVVRRPPSPEEGRDALRDEVVACYREFVGSLLDVTDNIVDDVVMPPPKVVRADGDDPYLVVAADKGTATLSDTANEIAAERGFWLGDAFASGGSVGYDHKAMGITARGAWESVKRHFLEMGVDTQTEPFTVAGVGDMSGDVFGNGMLLSRQIRLVGAFDHRHVFLDPDPDPATSYTERQRLFELPGSTWESYDRDLIAEGGGVWPRTAKIVPLSPQVRQLLDVEATELSPDELIQALLRAPVDLLWNGGVGTFVKASSQSHAEVGDKASDRIRVDADQLRCKVVGEGGNLGLTQPARIEFAVRGGRINTDAIDNSGGVDCSDHEVNIKILLDGLVRADELTRERRDQLLTEMTDEVAELVLANNRAQGEAISSAVANAAPMVDVHRRYLQHLEQRGLLDRALEGLPDDEELLERRQAGDGLLRPEFAVLLAYTKTLLYDELLASDLPDDPWLSGEVVRYFPTALREPYGSHMQRHRLRREIVATQVANALVNSAGTTLLFRLSEETGAAPTDITRAWLVARAVFDLDAIQDAVRGLGSQVPSATGIGMLLEARRLIERATRWLLRHLPSPIDVAAAVERFHTGAATVGAQLPEVLRGADRAASDETRAHLEEQGVPEALAARIAGMPAWFCALDIVAVADGDPEPAVVAATATYFALAERLHLDWLRQQIASLPRESRWDALARDALREDFFTQHGRLTAEVLNATYPADDADARVESWLRRHAAQARRCEQMLTEIASTQATDLARLSVALREIRDLRTVAR